MSDLTLLEKRKLERLLKMGGGYVLGFSNFSFDAFVVDSVGRSIYDAKYNYGSGSKANQLRGFWKEEANSVVAKLTADILDYMESELHQEPDEITLLAECRKIVTRLQQDGPVVELQTLALIGNEQDLDVVARAVRDSIDKNEPATALDRLHTFTTKYLRTLCAGETDRGKPLNSLFGEYVRKLHEGGHIESKMTASILKAMHGPLEAFNAVRNDKSLAHDNELLNHDEALLIVNHVTNCLRFLRDLEKRLQRKAEQEKASLTKVARDAEAMQFDDDVPF
jgi:hypothetical protein